MMADRMRSPLGRAYGLGTAREGARDWWMARLTSIALIPLTLWWVAAVIAHAGAGYGPFTHWVRNPVTSVLLILTLGVTFYHMALGLQVVIEDYIHGEGAKLAALITVKFGCIVLGVAGIFAVLRIAFGG
jgi:succinate dehydrogenase / fumarate reductase membrane anchor subunit